jgi:hypothetical protein
VLFSSVVILQRLCHGVNSPANMSCLQILAQFFPKGGHITNRVVKSIQANISETAMA